MHKYIIGTPVRRNCDAESPFVKGKIVGFKNEDEAYHVKIGPGLPVEYWHSDFFHVWPKPENTTIPVKQSALPTDGEERKTYPMFSGLLAYFPAALGAVSHHSYLGNEKHNPGKALQHARNKSGDHLDCLIRHVVDSREVTGAARITELSSAAWRVLAELQEEMERQGIAPAAPAATFK